MKTGRPQKLLNEKEITQLKALAQYGLTYEQIAIVLGVSRATLERKYKDQFNEGRTLGHSVIAKRAFERAKVSDVMTMFWLKCQAQWRERDKQELSETNLQLPKIVFFEHSNSKAK